MFDDKDPSEIIVVTFDFTALSTVVSAPVVSVILVDGVVDASPSAILSGVAQVTGAVVKQKIQGGVHGANYKLRCQVDTPLGERFIESAILSVVTQ